MKITLKNFRCYENETFDFGENGITLLSGSSGAGKCMGKDTIILMYDGTRKKIQDIKEGDLIMGDDSTPRSVLSTCKGEDIMYEVIPTKGRPYIVNSKHILTLKGNRPCYNFRKNRNKWVVRYMKNSVLKSKQFDGQDDAYDFYQSLEKEPINDICIEDYLKLGKTNQLYNYTFHVGVDFEEKSVLLDPYLLGIWLGDGTSKESSITSVDDDLIDYIKEILIKYDLCLRKNKITYRIINSEESTAISHSNTSGEQGVFFNRGHWVAQWKENGKIKGKYFSVKKNGEKAKVLAIEYIKTKVLIPKKRRNYFTDTLKKLKLWGNKHIPHVYKTNSRENRLKLLAGLIDTDGYVYKNTIEICQKRKQLAEDIEYLALSLGFMAVFKQVEKTCTNTGVTGIYYQVTIFGENLNDIPTIIKYKKLHQRCQTKRATVHGFKVNKIGFGDYYGFELDGNGRYLMGDFKVTHNTSILLGIYFALFGTGSKLAMYGKSSCTVTLEFDGMTITRSKRPNRLVVNSIYEDDAGQSVIDKKFGDSFKTTGYISQNARDSFILMSPIEKLGFLEKFAFQDINLSRIKKRCKDLIKERNENLLKTTSQLEMATLMLEELSEPEKIEFPLKCSKKNRAKAINNETIRSKNTCTLIKRCKKKIVSLQKELHSLQVLNAQITSKKDSLDSIVEKLADMSLEESTIEYDGDEKLQEYQDQLSILISLRELTLLQERYDEDVLRLENMKENEKVDKDEKIKSIEDTIWQEYTKNDCMKTIKDYQQIIKDLEKLDDLKTDLDRYVVDEDQLAKYIEELAAAKDKIEEKKKLLDKLEMQQEIFQCPSCSVQLRFQDDDLQILENSITTEIHEQEDIDMVSNEIDKLKRKIRSLESSIPIKQNKLERHKELSKSIQLITEQYEEIPDLSEMKKDLEYIRSYKSSQEELDRQLTDLKSNDSYSSTISSFEKSLRKQALKIKGLKKENKKYDKDIDEEELRLNIITQKRNKEKLESFSQETRKLNSEKITYEKDIKSFTEEHTEKYKKIRDVSTLEGKIQINLSELSALEKKQEEHRVNVENIEKYQEYKKALDTYNSWSTKIETLKKEEIECRKLYASATLLKEKILEAESIAMLNVISSINTHTQGYLEAFFPDNPISVKLVPFKETKSGKTVKRKPQINLEIEYKGMEADINMLSGGELSRVILSFALALGEMFNTPMMLLDECTASLDQELTGVVMDGIRELFSGKLVLIIAHQVVKGQFDKVIQIGTKD